MSNECEIWEKRALELARERDAERLAREAAMGHRRHEEERLREATERNLALLARAEQAERERDEAVASQEKTLRIASDARDLAERRRQEADDANTARERAEADNAAWLECAKDGPPTLRKMASRGDHHGAALLAEVEALRRVRSAIRLERVDGTTYVMVSDDIGAAYAAVDALKGAP